MSSFNKNTTTISASSPIQSHIPLVINDVATIENKPQATTATTTSSHTATAKRTRPTKDRQKKVDGRGRRIYISRQTTARLYQLTSELNHRSHGETVEWLMNKLDESRALAASAAPAMPAQGVTMTPAAAPPPLLTPATVPAFPVPMQRVPAPAMVGPTGQYRNVPVGNPPMQSVEEEFGKYYFESVDDSYFHF